MATGWRLPRSILHRVASSSYYFSTTKQLAGKLPPARPSGHPARAVRLGCAARPTGWHPSAAVRLGRASRPTRGHPSSAVRLGRATTTASNRHPSRAGSIAGTTTRDISRRRVRLGHRRPTDRHPRGRGGLGDTFPSRHPSGRVIVCGHRPGRHPSRAVGMDGWGTLHPSGARHGCPRGHRSHRGPGGWNG